MPLISTDALRLLWHLQLAIPLRTTVTRPYRQLVRECPQLVSEDCCVRALRELERCGLIALDYSLDSASALEVTMTPDVEARLRGVFVVHGHDTELRAQVEAFLLRTGLDPIIIADRPSGGRTIIEQIESYGDVQFAVVLMTPDDEGHDRAAPVLALRARQNVVLELGYFLGRLGRSRVRALHRGDVELPSDYLGVVYTALDQPNSDWRVSLLRELRLAGLPVRDFGSA